jgi:hypothetical protein
VAEIGKPVPKFLSSEQFSALERLADLIMPPQAERPGAKQASAAEFLDFLISESPADRQQLYRAGLDKLNAEAGRRGGKLFSSLTPEDASDILKPLAAAWTYEPPSDAFARFLLTAKEDILRATYNSREFTTAMSRVSRGFSGSGYYWLPIE